MCFAANISAQNSFSFNGLWNISEKSTALLNTIENNPSGFISLKDWGLSISYGSEFSKPAASNIYAISLSKRLNEHVLTARYSPGFIKEFSFSSGESILLDDSSSQSLNSRFIYKEILGFGYSYSFSPKFNLGFSLRYFTQEFNNETFKPILSDTLYYLERENINERVNFWNCDFGLNYFVSDWFMLSVSSINLLNFGEPSNSEENKQYELRTNKNAAFRFTFVPYERTSLNLLYETNNSFQAGVNKLIEIGSSTLGFSIAAQHDKYQSPFVNGILGGIVFSNDLWGMAFTGTKYLSSRNQTYSYSDFKSEGIHSLLNNKYSFDKAVLSFNLTLNTIKEQIVKFSSVEIVREIYPTFFETYVDSPFAYGRVVNLSDKEVFVRPLSFIEGLNNDFIQSPTVAIQPKDTAIVPFFTYPLESYTKQRVEISQAYFALSSSSDEFDDKTQDPILINGINSWDGNVRNLRYFIKKDLAYSMSFSKNILSSRKTELDTIRFSLSQFFKAKYIYNSLVKELVYTSDPRASTEYVQFPNETIKLRGGDCDDLSVCYSSLLESVGIETALVDYKNTSDIRHVNVLFNTNLTPDDAVLITENDSKYFIRKDENGDDEVWIPIETTSLTDFDTAWNIGAEKFYNDGIQNLGLAANKVEIIDIN